jgi:hypothetical protein
MLSLIDGAKPIIELYKPEEGYNTGWRERWLQKANTLLAEYEHNLQQKEKNLAN